MKHPLLLCASAVLTLFVPAPSALAVRPFYHGGGGLGFGYTAPAPFYPLQNHRYVMPYGRNYFGGGPRFYGPRYHYYGGRRYYAPRYFAPRYYVPGPSYYYPYYGPRGGGYYYSPCR